MALSRFALERAERRAALAADLVRAVTGLDADAEDERQAANARLATAFCIDNIEQPPSSAGRGPRAVQELFEGVAGKLQAHSARAKGTRLLCCLQQLRELVGDSDEEGVFTSLATILHELSHAPSQEALDQDAACLAMAKKWPTHAVEDLAESIRLRLSPLRERRTLSVAESSETSDASDSGEQDWLNESFSSSSSLSDDDFDDDDLETRGGVEGSTGGNDGGRLATGDDEVAERGTVDETAAAHQVRSLGKSVDAQERARETTHFNARCRRGILALLSEKEEQQCEVELLGATADRIVHEGEVVRAVLLALHGNLSTGLFIHNEQGEVAVNEHANFAFAHTSRHSLTSSLDRFASGVSALAKVRHFCRGSIAPSLVEQAVCAELDLVLREFECTFTKIEREVQAAGLVTLDARQKTSASGRAVTLLALEGRLFQMLDEASELADLTTDLECATVGTAGRERARVVSELVYRRAMEDFVADFGQTNRGSVPTRVLWSAVTAQVRQLSELLDTGQVPDPFNELFIRVSALDDETEIAAVQAESVPCFWQPVAQQLAHAVEAVRLLRFLCLNERDASVAWPLPELALPPLLELFEQRRDARRGESRAVCSPNGAWSSDVSELLLRWPLFDLVEERCQQVGQIAMRLVMQQHQLVEHMGAVHALFFAQDELALSPFLRDLFHAVDRDLTPEEPLAAEAHAHFSADDQWATRIPPGALGVRGTVDRSARDTLLTGLLAGDMEGTGPVGLSVSLDAGDEGCGVRALDGIRINVRIEPPLSAVLGPASLQLYRAIFKLLVQVKRTLHAQCRLQQQLRRHALCSARMGSGKAGAGTGQLHQVSLELARQLHFVTHLHAYLLHRLAHAPWRRLAKSARSAQSLAALRDAHLAFLRRVAIQCLLDAAAPERPTSVLQAVQELLDGALRFRSLALAVLLAHQRLPHTPGPAQRALDQLAPQVEAARRRFQRTYRFLLVMLSQRAAAGGVQHLDEVLVRLDFNRDFARPAAAAATLNPTIHKI